MSLKSLPLTPPVKVNAIFSIPNLFSCLLTLIPLPPAFNVFSAYRFTELKSILPNKYRRSRSGFNVTVSTIKLMLNEI